MVTEPYDPLPWVSVEAFATFIHCQCSRCSRGTSFYVPYLQGHPEALVKFHEKHRTCKEAPVVRICDNCAFETEETHTPAVLDEGRTSWSIVHATPTKILRCHALPTIVEVAPGRPACIHFKARES